MTDQALTTNDVRVLRLLTAHGPHTEHEIGQALRHGLGGAAATRRLPMLLERCLISPAKTRGFEATGDGVRALLIADRAAYGSYA